MLSNCCKYNVHSVLVVAGIQHMQVLLSGIFFLDIFDLWLVEFMNEEPVDTEGQLQRSV